MPAEKNFYVYRVVDASGATTHSSILYVEDATAARGPGEVRDNLLTAAQYAMNEFQLPEWDDAPDADTRIELLGPFALGEPVASMLHKELAALPEEERP